jgi:MarR family transcriptional regulator, organic hydroperoxide resistance regulator
MPSSRERPPEEDAASVGLGEVIEFMRLLWAVDHGLAASSKHMDATYGITGPQRLVIRIVGRHPGIAAGRIAEILHVHPSTLTGVLSRLTTRKMLTRQVDPEDGRRALFALTAAGRKLDELRSGTIEAKVRRALGKISARELTAARKVLSGLAEALDPPARGGGSVRRRKPAR